MAAPIVFFDIAAPDETLKDFYKTVFDWETDKQEFAVPVKTPLSGTIRQDPTEKLLYIGVDDINATMEIITDNGGSVDVPRFEVPGLVVLGLFKDPAGNRMGLVEMDGDKAKVP